MGRKRKKEKQAIEVLVDGRFVKVTLSPPTKRRKSWYAFWKGLITSRSTGHSNFEQAVEAVHDMLHNGGKKSEWADTVLSDQEFLEIQRAHFHRKTDAASKARSQSSLLDCEDAIQAFKLLSGLAQIATATPDDCARFQRKALSMPLNWRRSYPKQKETEEKISPNTIRKWSRTLQAAFERVNHNAGKKCVRGVVPKEKLIGSNPWNQFTWIEGRKKLIRQFNDTELRSLLDYLESNWKSVPIAVTAAKVFLWSCCRKMEVSSLKWDQLRSVDEEVHFELVGKWGVERWFRIPKTIFDELSSFRTRSPYVFGAYSEQIRRAHRGNPGCLKKIRSEYNPRNFGRWMYERIKCWASDHKLSDVELHVFRKTALQHVHDGQEGSLEAIAKDAGVSKTVLLGHYVKPDLRLQSNRTYRRIANSLSGELRALLGYEDSKADQLRRELEEAAVKQNWERVRELAGILEATSSASVA